MKIIPRINFSILIIFLLLSCSLNSVLAKHSKSYTKHSIQTTSSHNVSKHSTKFSKSSKSKHIANKNSRKSYSIAHSSSKKHLAHLTKSYKHSSKYHSHHIATKTRYAYPLGFFMTYPPKIDLPELSESEIQQIKTSFDNGQANAYPVSAMIKSGLFQYHKLHGGIFWRREPIEYIVMHSTETGVPQSAPRVIDSWGSMGIRHPGAQFVVDRDGKIYMACDPDLATVHLNIFKTLPGINNDNCIGIEMVHCSSQNYTNEQLSSVSKLVSYLKTRYHVKNKNIITHRYAQQGDHTDPVNFNWNNFIAYVHDVDSRREIAYVNKINKLTDDKKIAFKPDSSNVAKKEPIQEIEKPSVTDTTTYLQMHKQIKNNSVNETIKDTAYQNGTTQNQKSNINSDTSGSGQDDDKIKLHGPIYYDPEFDNLP